MKALILGGSGMLGHKACQTLSGRFDVYTTVRRELDSVSHYGVFDPARTIGHVSAEEFQSVVGAIDSVQPAVVVNCIGIVKQAEAAKDPLPSISVNSLFPQRLARLCQEKGMRLIHISTDCVFSGRRGGYLETDQPDAEDLYGRTKLLGEVEGKGCLTLRTSMIGRELETSFGLVEWFLGQDGKAVSGYKRAIFSGFTTIALSEVIARIITEHPYLEGVWHVASEPISKFDLLSLMKEVYGLSIGIEPDESVVCYRSLNCDRFRRATGFVAPRWPDMIRQMYSDPTPYLELRRRNAKQHPK
jgi:dTDP-4-dehydrorhamnose reductase